MEKPAHQQNRILLMITLIILFCFPVIGQEMLIQAIDYRAVSPYRTGSWIAAIAVPESANTEFKYSWYVAGRNGGVWKTENNGTSFFPIFDSVGVSSIGALAVSKSHPEIVWVASGEAFNARSSHAGEGVFKSGDGGKSWSHMGLDDSQHLSSIVIHPENPDIVWVASMGHLFTPNAMRGVFKTTDGGISWSKVLFIDENTGIIDLIIHPQNPDILFAAAYEKYRFPWHFEAGGNRSGIYKTVDGGDHWTLLETGLPKGKLGRIGLALCYNQPEVVYAVIENLNPKPGIEIDESNQMNHMRDAYFDQMIGGEVYRSEDEGTTWEKRNDTTCNVSSKAAYSFNKIMVASDDPNILYVTSDLMQYSDDGGKTWLDCQWPPKVLSQTIFGDHRTMWVDPLDGRHIMFGSDGGLYESFDRGKTFTHHGQIPLGEVYHVETDNAYPYNIYVGLQDHEAWKGPSNSWSGEIGPENWMITGMWDGMYTRVDPTDNRWLYTTTQFGGHLRVDQNLGRRTGIEPKAPENNPPYRFCWTVPLEISPHNSKIIYTGGQMLLRSLDQGDNWEEISPDLTTNDAEKIAGKGHMMYCTITTISESPVKAGVIWAGTDDGRIWMTPDHGRSWKEFTAVINELGGDDHLWVSRIVASSHKAGKAFVCKSGFRNDDFRPLIFRTDDHGKNWVKITDGLPESPVNAIAEDPNRRGLLYLATDEGVFLSIDDGKTWKPFRNNMPVVPVKHLKVHPDENDLVVGTYGRGAYIADTWPLQFYNDSIFNEDLFLFPIESKPQSNYSERAWWGNYKQTGDNHLYTPNEVNGLALYYFVKEPDSTWIEICDMNRESLDTLALTPTKGIHRVHFDTWNLQPGSYQVILHHSGEMVQQPAEVKQSAIWPIGHGVKN